MYDSMNYETHHISRMLSYPFLVYYNKKNNNDNPIFLLNPEKEKDDYAVSL